MSIGSEYIFMEKLPIGQRVKEVRVRRGISQAKLARLIGITQPSLSQIEAGRTEPRESTLLAIARILEDDLGDEEIRRKLREGSPGMRRPWDAIIQAVVSYLDRHPLYAYLFAYRVAKASPAFRDLMKPGMLEILEQEIEPLIAGGRVRDEEDLTDEVSRIEPLTASDVVLAPIVARIEGPNFKGAHKADSEDDESVIEGFRVRKRK